MNCVLLSGGLFQIYSNHKENYISFEDMKNKLIKLYINTNPNISKIFNKYEKINREFNNNIQQLNENFIKDLGLSNNNLFSTQINNFETIDLSLLYSFLSKFKKIYFSYDNALYLLFDINIFSLLNIDTNNIIFCINLNLEEKNNKNYIIFDTKLSRLLSFHKKGFFTVYLCHLVKMDLYTEEHKNYIDNYNKSNLDIINNYGFFFDFAITFMVQIIHYIKYIENYEKNLVNIEGKNLSEKIIKKTGAKNILLIYRFFWKKGELKRINFFLCTNDVLYSTYCGDNKNNCYTYFNKYYINNNKYFKPKGILAKLSSKICLNDYNELIKDLIIIKKENNDIMFFNNVENTKKYLIRGLQIDMIKNFINNYIKDIKNIKLPKSKEELYINIDTFDKFNFYLKQNDIKYPLMLKFSGQRKIYDHLIINILCEDGLNNFINYFKEYTKNDTKENIKIVIQEFINHGGYVIKLYRIKNKSYFYYRPSFPDAKIDFISKYEEYKNGFIELLTSDLVSSKYHEFWQKINGVNENYKNNVNENLLDNIGKKFEEYSGDTLLGLDFLLDKDNNIYYLIDVNQFPGYKELNKDMGKILMEHILYYIKN